MGVCILLIVVALVVGVRLIVGFAADVVDDVLDVGEIFLVIAVAGFVIDFAVVVIVVVIFLVRDLTVVLVAALVIVLGLIVDFVVVDFIVGFDVSDFMCVGLNETEV